MTQSPTNTPHHPSFTKGEILFGATLLLALAWVEHKKHKKQPRD
jgi:hypothetical protein